MQPYLYLTLPTIHFPPESHSNTLERGKHLHFFACFNIQDLNLNNGPLGTGSNLPATETCGRSQDITEWFHRTNLRGVLEAFSSEGMINMTVASDRYT